MPQHCRPLAWCSLFQPTSGDFEPLAELFAPSGDRVTFWYLSNGAQRIQLPEESGTYMLMVSDARLDATGDYTIGYEGIHPISPSRRDS